MTLLSDHVPDLFEEYPVLQPIYFGFEKEWDINKESEFCAETLLHAVALCCLYFALCFGGRRIMKDKTPFDLKRALAAWNLMLAVFSFIGSTRTVPFLLNTIYRRGIYHSVCSKARPHYGHSAVGFWVMLFIYSKIPELFDTMFIVLRKKPLLFLHWYHHITVFLFCWHSFATQSPLGIYFAAMNYTVHAIMYFYYFLTAVGYRPRWALLVTVLQLSQMVVGVGVCTMAVYYMQQGVECYVDLENLKWGIIMYASYFALFLKFFVDRYYNKKPQKKSLKKTQ